MTNTYLAGFETLNAETRGAELTWQGTPPPWLNGVLLRNGPAKFEAGTTAYRHLFDGLAMLHRFPSKGIAFAMPIGFCAAAPISMRLRASPLPAMNSRRAGPGRSGQGFWRGSPAN